MPNDNLQPDRLDRIENLLGRLAERQEALTMNLELAARDIENLKILAQRDGEHIKLLASNAQTLHASIQGLENIAAAHEDRAR
jgi:septal ring factor EnvC (AmiA/AmiB activator)